MRGARNEFIRRVETHLDQMLASRIGQFEFDMSFIEPTA
jgi:hypothetical protein